MRIRLWWLGIVAAGVLGAAGVARAQVNTMPGTGSTLGGYTGIYGAPGVNQPGVPGMAAPGGLAAPQTGTLPPGVSSGGYNPSANQYVYGSYPSLNPGLNPGLNNAPTGYSQIYGGSLPSTTAAPPIGQPGVGGYSGFSSGPLGASSPGGLQALPSGPTGAGGGF